MVEDYSYEDYNKDLEMCNALIKRYFQKYNNDSEDLRQVGIIGILKARESFRAGISRFSTYLWSCCYNEMLQYVKRKIIKNNEHENLSLNANINSKEDNLTIEDTIEDKSFNFDDFTELLVIKDVLRDYIKSLPKDSKVTKITKLALLGYSSKEIMEKLGCTVSYINRVKQEFKAKLKLMLDKELR